LEQKEIISSGILELFVLGQTNAAETQQVLAWKKIYPEVAAEIEAIEISMEQYAMSKSIAPATHVKDRLFATIVNAQQMLNDTKIIALEPNTKSQVSNKWKWLAAASFILFMGACLSGILLYNKYKQTGNDLATVKQELIQKENTSIALQKNLDAITASNSQSIVLNGTENSPTSTAKIFWVKNTGEVFVAPSGLPKAPGGMQYQLWAIVDGQPVDAGLLLDDNTGNKYNVQKMKSFGKAEAFAITLEKTGGSTSPLGKMVVMSKT
jgi:hypothetical protein